ncbi:MAG TPA: sigma-54 dependent transcriptional regulator [bacterium]|nr:sigma-54 dependent transcriptional regulator [bacterium]
METKTRVLIVDDDSAFCESTCDGLSLEGYDVRYATTGREGLEYFKTWNPSIVLLDQKLPDILGSEIDRQIRETDPGVKVIFATAYGSLSEAVEAVKNGAYHYFTKPIELDEFYFTVAKAARLAELERLNRITEFQLERARQTDEFVGDSAAIQETKRLIELAAQTDSTILITGETGVGKGVAARAIHRLSGRKDDLLSVNCASIPENLIESELFGYEKGAFTGAESQRKGVFELVKDGTLLLDEIAEMPLQLQSKLLTVLEEGRIRRLGGDVDIPLNVRVIATTNRPIVEDIKNGRFREDLYYRLAVITINVPPLRECREDIPILCKSLLENMTNGIYGELPEEQFAALMIYRWPGNVRELRNILERSVILAAGGELDPASLIEGGSGKRGGPGTTEIRPLADVECDYIERAMKFYRDNKTHAATALGISLSTLRRRVANYECLGKKTA